MSFFYKICAIIFVVMALWQGLDSSKVNYALITVLASITYAIIHHAEVMKEGK